MANPSDGRAPSQAAQYSSASVHRVAAGPNRPLDKQAYRRCRPKVTQIGGQMNRFYCPLMRFQPKRGAEARDPARIFTADHRQDSRSSIKEDPNVELSMPMVVRREIQWDQSCKSTCRRL